MQILVRIKIVLCGNVTLQIHLCVEMQRLNKVKSLKIIKLIINLNK